MSNLKLKYILLKEQFHITDVMALEKAASDFAKMLINKKIIGSHHKNMTAADTNINQYTEDIAEVVRNEIIKWMDVANRRGAR